MSLKGHSIGVFDSGIGGLTVLKELRRLLPGEDFIYFGDTARVPYGTKSPETIMDFASQIIDFLLGKKVKIIVAACNTVSSLVLDDLEKKYKNIPVLGVVRPGAQNAVAVTRNGRVGVIGTVSTIRSGSYKNEILERNRKIRVYEQACPLFVSLVESGWTGNDVARLTAETYLKPVLAKKIDTLVLGCTHYPVLKSVLRKVTGPEIRLVDSAFSVSRETVRFLMGKDLLRDPERQGRVQYWLSDSSEYFIQAARYILKDREVSVRLKRL